MKRGLIALTLTALAGFHLASPNASAATSHAVEPALWNITEDTFVRIPALEFTIATVKLDHFLRSVPLQLSQTERALSQMGTGMDYNDGMIWFTFKTGGKRGLIDQVRNLRLTKRARASYRLASRSPYTFTRNARPMTLALGARQPEAAIPPVQVASSSPASASSIPKQRTSHIGMTLTGPGDLTIDRHSRPR